MKNIYTKLCLSAIGCLMMASCDFLDVVPQGTATCLLYTSDAADEL